MSANDPTEPTRILGPINRVEGDLELKLQINDSRVTSAWVNAPLFRGFEQILHGKDPRDALVYTPRICGICSVSQSIAAATALAQAQQHPIVLPDNGALAINLMLATENMADHLSHFYIFFMPDFARDHYKSRDWFPAIQKRFKAQIGDVYQTVLPARAAFLHLTGILAGKWPHSLAIQPGGSTRPIQSHEITRMQATVRNFRSFIESTTFGDTLESVTALGSMAALNQWCDRHSDSDLASFMRISNDIGLHHLGKTDNRFLSYGAYPLHDDQQHLFAAGCWQNDQTQPLDTSKIQEDLSNSWLHRDAAPQHPFDGRTLVDVEQTDGYSWCKAPRLAGQVMEVGALARQVVNGHPLLLDCIRTQGASVTARVIARLMELALVVPAMEAWLGNIRSGDPFCNSYALPKQAQGAGLVEAARGSLGHWLRIDGGRIQNYQIIAPTTWNFSPRDSEGTPGALEQALAGTELENANPEAVEVQHIVRSFDPCMVCTVH